MLDLSLLVQYGPALLRGFGVTILCWGAGCAIGIVAGVWFQDVHIGGIIAAAMCLNMLAAALAGILIPLVLDRFGADPAVSSAVFVTAVTDIVGFFSFLGIATWWYGISG